MVVAELTEVCVIGYFRRRTERTAFEEEDFGALGFCAFALGLDVFFFSVLVAEPRLPRTVRFDTAFSFAGGYDLFA